MGKKQFTAEEIEALSQSPYVVKVTEKSIHFNAEFKKMIVRERQTGKPSRQILSELGINSKVLGKNRVDSLFNRTKEQSKRPSGFERLPMRGRPKKITFSSPEEEIQYLKDRNEYLKQENEFLKKLKVLERGE